VKLNSYGQYKVVKRVRGEALKFEVFVGWTEADKTFLYFGIDKGVEASAFLPVGARDFHGVSLPVPADPERVNEAIYGPGWRTPDPSFTYALDAAKWKPFLFLRSTPNLGYWNDYYARRKPDEPWSLLPSQFAAFVANETSPGRMLEIGCGNGRDALFFASVGYKVQGADYCETAIGLCRERAETLGLKARFETLNICDVAQVTTFAGRHADTYDTVYARFFVHAITELGEEELFKLCAAVLKPGGRAFLEFRTTEDERASAGRELSASEREDGHYRRFIDVDRFVDRAATHGLRTAYRVAGQGMATFRGEDPHVARVVLERPGEAVGAG
jgi:cyclopropane fatty-acyl-phospholipid synthase-like methyltransferase